MRLNGKAAIITGAASGIGREMAAQFTAAGAQVLAVDWNQERLDDTVRMISDAGGTISGVFADVSDQGAAEGLVGAALTAYGRLDVLVNNAAVMDYMEGVGELSDDIWRRVLSINLDGPMYISRSAVRHMLEHGGGSIVNVASAAGTGGGAAGAAYTVAKHGLVGLTRNTAWMYAQRGVRCNAICPGSTNTTIGESMPPERVDPVGGERAGVFGALMPRLLEPDEIAAVAVFLASDESRALSGAIIAADAGWSAT
jgi:NAD(P)-dependent dehydrogenase (short-subunit alcohol dehydrogenase family)